MTFALKTFLIVSILTGATSAWAQDSTRRVPLIEVTIIPAGATHFVEASETGEPSFTNYDAGAALAINFTDIVAVEGEVSGSLGVSQSLSFATFQQELTSPNLLHYQGNVVVSMRTDTSIIPFFTVGGGGLTVFDRAEVIQRTDSFFAGNAGGGVKWRTRRWGLRADYRFIAVRGRHTEFAPNERPRPDFFGKETRFGHRVFAGIILNVG